RRAYRHARPRAIRQLLAGGAHGHHPREFRGDRSGRPRRASRRPRFRRGHTADRGSLEFGIGLLFDDGRAREEIDLLLECGAPVVLLVDRACKLHEGCAEILFRLALPDVVLDHPERFVDGLELAFETAHLRAVVEIGFPSGFEHGKLVTDIGELCLVRQPLRLDAQNGDLVDELTRTDLDHDGFGVLLLGHGGSGVAGSEPAPYSAKRAPLSSRAEIINAVRKKRLRMESRPSKIAAWSKPSDARPMSLISRLLDHLRSSDMPEERQAARASSPVLMV